MCPWPYHLSLFLYFPPFCSLHGTLGNSSSSCLFEKKAGTNLVPSTVETKLKQNLEQTCEFHAAGRRLRPLPPLPQSETIVNLDVPQVQTFSISGTGFHSKRRTWMERMTWMKFSLRINGTFLIDVAFT